MLIAHNVCGARGFHLPRLAIARYLWHNKITSVDYLLTIDPGTPYSERLEFMVEAFHVREVISGRRRERSTRSETG